jgi:hypothetical protein
MGFAKEDSLARLRQLTDVGRDEAGLLEPFAGAVGELVHDTVAEVVAGPGIPRARIAQPGDEPGQD